MKASPLEGAFAYAISLSRRSGSSDAAGGVHRSTRRDSYVDPAVKDKLAASEWIDPPSHPGGDHAVFNQQLDVRQS